MMQLKTTILSSRKQNLVLLVFCMLAMGLFFVFAHYLKTFKRNHISSDVVEYYSFVPAMFECKDLSFQSGCPSFYWAQVNKEGRHVNKRSIGMAYMYTPFYALAQLVSNHKDASAQRTQKILVLGIWVYVCIGLFFLGKALFRFFPPWVVIATLFTLIAATNLIWYTNGEPLFTHGVNFMWLSILIYATIIYHEQQKLGQVVVITLSIAMLTLIRPNNLLLGLFPLLYGVYNKQSLYAKAALVKKQYAQILLAGIISIIPAIPQLMYWKYASGHWIYYSYQGEKFYWLRPLVMDVLFSFRKGWLLYTPVMLLSIVGILFIKRRAKLFFLPVVVIIPAFIYIISCWWAWSYGGCYGMRPMVDVYALLAFPFAAFIYQKKWFFLIPILGGIVFCAGLNIFQAWQYSEGIIHFDQMNKQVYYAVWKKKVYPHDYDLQLSYPDYFKELAGKGSFYKANELGGMEVSIKFIRAKFVCATDSLGLGVNAKHQNANTCDAFVLVYNAFQHAYYIQSAATGNYFKMDRKSNIIHCSEPDILKADVCSITELGYNKFALKAPNGLYITCTEQNGFLLKADAAVINGAAYVVIRKYIR